MLVYPLSLYLSICIYVISLCMFPMNSCCTHGTIKGSSLVHAIYLWVLGLFILARHIKSVCCISRHLGQMPSHLAKNGPYRLVSNIRRTLVGNLIVDHSDVPGATPVGAAPTTSSFSTEHLASIYCAKATASQVKKHLSFEIWWPYIRDFTVYLQDPTDVDIIWPLYDSWNYIVCLKALLFLIHFLIFCYFPHPTVLS